VERAFVIALVLYLILLVAWPGSALESLAAFAAYVLGAWIAVRLLRIGLRKLTWRLRNRLIVAYVFIAVLPILLILTLVGLGGYILAGQVAVYLVRSELDRRVSSLRFIAEDLIASPSSIQRLGESAGDRIPGLVLWVNQNGSATEWPSDAQVTPPADQTANSGGFAVREGHYYVWAGAVSGGKEALALAPLSRRNLSEMVPGLGDVYFTRFSPEVKGEVRFTPAGGDAPLASLPRPVNEFDIGVRWGSILSAVSWDHPRRTESALLLGYSHLSSILLNTLSQSGDFVGSTLLILFYILAIAFLLVAITGLGIGISMSRSITGAVHALYQGTQRVIHGDFSHLIPVTGHDQLAELSTSFNTMTENLERLIAVSKEKERLETEIEIARGVQDQLYPKAPPVFENLQVLGKCDPARMVSGDYYDYQLVDGKLALAIGDVAGKGISAALLMATIQAAVRMELRASSEQKGDMAAPSLNGQRYSTARMVAELNQQLYATTSPEKYATFFFAVYDPATGLLTYTNAGHLQPLLVRDGVASLLDVSGLMVGAFPFAKYEESKLELRSGDLLVCYTDGVTEPENEYGEMFGEQRLIDVIAKNTGRDEAWIIESVMESVREWTGTPELSDDMTVLLARKS